MQRRSDFFLILIFLLSLLLLPLAGKWDAYQQQIRERQFIQDRQEKAREMAQQFHAHCTLEAQMRKYIQSAEISLNDFFAENGAVFRKSLIKKIPVDWLGKEPAFFLFRKSGQNFKAMAGEGLERQNTGFIARIISQMCDWQKVGVAERAKVNNRLASLFGPRVGAEILLDNRGGRFIDVVFNGQRQFLIWDFLRKSGEIEGAWLLISSNKPDVQTVAKKTLEQIHLSARSLIVPILLPIESLKEYLKPLNVEQSRGENSLLHFYSVLSEKERYDLVASFSTGIIHRQTFLFRTFTPRHLPYELWLVAEKTENNDAFLLKISSSVLVVFWLSIFLVRFRLARPFNFSVRMRLMGLIVMVGGLPVIVLALAGNSFIDENHIARYRTMIEEIRAKLRQIDDNSSSLRIIFENAARKFMADSRFKQTIESENVDADNFVVRQCFADFKKAGVPLESIGIIRFGKPEQMIFSPEKKNQEKSRLLFFSPLMYSGLRNFSEKSHNEAMANLNESQRLGLGAYQSVISSSLFSEFSMARQKSFLMSFGDSGILIFFDYIAISGKVKMAVMFFAPADQIFDRYLRIALQRGQRADKNWMIASAENRSGLIQATLPKINRPPVHEKFLLSHLAQSARNSSNRVAANEDSLVVCQPSMQMPGKTIGALVSLEPLHSITRRQRQVLRLVTAAFAILIVIISFSLVSYFLKPLQTIENGIQAILQKNFDLRLNLDRDDELGDVANAFDGMAQGLFERHELAKFVSGALFSTIDVEKKQEKQLQKRWGVVLASDIRSFTTMSEAYPPEEIVSMLNRHLELMSSEIIRYNGEIDKFIGDAIIAVFFGDNQSEVCRNAVAAARSMMLAHKAAIARRLEQGEFAYGIGIGLACGDLVSGPFGEGVRKEFILSGIARHESEELEARSKNGRFSHIVVSSEVCRILPDLVVAPLHTDFEVIEL
ncbi:MAG: adenylate/guanylate cyclase domain-containing protein [Candidatus Rifleibacteriota bacterium]